VGGQTPAPDKHWAYWLALSALVNVTLTGLVVLLLRWPAPGAIRIETPRSSVERSGLTVPVYVSGAVRQPGVYWLKDGAIAQDAVQAAGGPDEGADLAAVNLAARVAAGAQVHVPQEGELPAQPSRAVNAGGLVNINTASAEELESLPGIGPALAGRILAYRDQHGPFSTIEELMNVSGIGERTLESLRLLVTVD